MGFFDGLAGAIVSGAASLFGGASANNQTAKSAASAQALNAEEFRLQHLWDEANLGRAEMRDDARYQDAKASTNAYYMDAKQYETEMSNSAHQREVADLRLAGLNPILSAGGGASSPNLNAPTISATAGPMGQTHGAQSGVSTKFNDVMTPAMNSALSTYRGLNEIKNIQKEGDILEGRNKQITSETELTKQRQETEKKSQENLAYDSKLKKATTETTKSTSAYNYAAAAAATRTSTATAAEAAARINETNARAETLRSQLPVVKTKAKTDSGKFGEIMNYIDRITGTVGRLFGVGNSGQDILNKQNKPIRK
ncbi:MAG: hypothetical protein HGB35_03545 [Geobacteraceae bacterium]|nr:hypothetical protein [Geobacteraceae bacterium]